jgi:hypothetical protein
MAIEAGARQGRNLGDHLIRRIRTRVSRIAEQGTPAAR